MLEPFSASDPDFDDPFDVSDHLLEITRIGYVSRNFSLFASRFILPHVVGTFEGDQVISDTSELQRVYDRMCAHFDSIGAFDLRRRTLAARFVDQDHVQATFVSQCVLRGYALGEEVVAHGTLRRDDGIWRVAEGRYATQSHGVTRALSSLASR